MSGCSQLLMLSKSVIGRLPLLCIRRQLMYCPKKHLNTSRCYPGTVSLRLIPFKGNNT